MSGVYWQFDDEALEDWGDYMSALETSLGSLETDIEETADMTRHCTDEWCQATEHVIDDINNALFTISEPRWTSEEASQRIKALKRRVRALYTKNRGRHSGRPALDSGGSVTFLRVAEK